jgi:hypothetical protein
VERTSDPARQREDVGIIVAGKKAKWANPAM